MAIITSNGGGATHIAKVTGQLSSLSNNLSDILMVSGGGGGGLLVGDTDYSGKEAGGISGSGDNSADQSTGYAFGQGESGTDVSGGGSGLYGGYKGTSSKSGGAGSGYIGNALVSNKKMVGYNVPTSDAESTKTESVDEASESPVSAKPKIGNGHAKIKFLRDLIETDLSSLAKNTDFVNHRKVSQQSTNNISFQYTFADLTNYYLSDWNLSGHANDNSYSNGEFMVPNNTQDSGGFAIPIYSNRLIYGMKFDCKVEYISGYGSVPRQGFLELIRIDSGNTVTRIDLLRICRDPSTSYDPNNPLHRLVTDDLYHTYEFIFDNPVTFDYVHINGSYVNSYVKNIKLLA